MDGNEISIRALADKGKAGKRDRAAFVDLGRAFAARLPHSVPQLRSEQIELVDPERNPFFEHASVQLFLAMRGGKPVGRISAQIDHLALEISPEQGLGPGTGMFGYFDAEDEETARALLHAAENWLREQGMTRVLGPISLSIWEEPGLLVKGQDHPPMIMMGHHPAHYRAWVEDAGYTHEKSLLTYSLDIDRPFSPLIQRIIKSGKRSEKITVRPVDLDSYDKEIETILGILNDAWSANWGFVPFTPAEVAYAGKKLKPIIKAPLNRIAEIDGKPVAFMLTFPNMNDIMAKIDGKLFPFGWFHLLRWLKNPQGAGMRVPLMGVSSDLHNSRTASQLAFMMIEDIREQATGLYGSTRGEVGWVLDDNQGMIAIADAIESDINREYVIFSKAL